MADRKRKYFLIKETELIMKILNEDSDSSEDESTQEMQIRYQE